MWRHSRPPRAEMRRLGRLFVFFWVVGWIFRDPILPPSFRLNTMELLFATKNAENAETWKDETAIPGPPIPPKGEKTGEAYSWESITPFPPQSVIRIEGRVPDPGGRGLIEKDPRVGMPLKERSRALERARAPQHLPDGHCLVAAEGQQNYPARRQDRLQAHGDAACRRVVASEPLAIRLDRNRSKIEHAPGRIGEAAGFVEAEVAVLAKAKNSTSSPPPSAMRRSCRSTLANASASSELTVK